MAATLGMSISVDQATLQAILSVRVHSHLPQEYGGDSVRVLVPTPCLRTGTIQPNSLFYTPLEEIISWLARIGPQISLVRL